MLTPKQLKSYDFQSVSRNAYKSTDVDEFMSEIYDSYEQMFRENGELVKKLSLLAEKLSEYKSDSDNIRNALLTAERMKDTIIKEAEDQAKATLTATEEKVKSTIEAVNDKTSTMLDTANENADKIVFDAKYEAKNILRDAQEKATTLLTKAQTAYDEKMDALKSESKREQAVLDTLKSSSNDLRSKLKELYTCHLELVEDMPIFDTSYNESDYDEEYVKSYEGESVEDIRSLKDFLDDAQSEDIEENLTLEDSDEPQVDSYAQAEIEETKENDIDSYIDDDDNEDDVQQYVPLEYISDEGDDYNDKDSSKKDITTVEKSSTKQGGLLLEEYDEEFDEEIFEEEDSQEEENIEDLSVNLDNFLDDEDDDDEDINTLKNFFNAKETQEY